MDEKSMWRIGREFGEGQWLSERVEDIPAAFSEMSKHLGVRFGDLVVWREGQGHDAYILCQTESWAGGVVAQTVEEARTLKAQLEWAGMARLRICRTVRGQEAA